jgi:hypothetical protein
MKNASPGVRILLGAITGALLSIFIGFVGLSIVGILFGYGGPLLALYFFGGIVLYVAPIGLLLGAVATSFRLVRNTPNQYYDRTKSGKPVLKLTNVVWIVLPLIFVLGVVLVPYVLTNVSRDVRHGATWTTESRSDCATPAVILMLTEYASYEVVCSQKLLSYLEKQNASVVPITFHVIYDFGNPRSYQLVKVGLTEITWHEWLEGPSGCGAKYLPPCDSPQAKNDSLLYNSSWLGQ